jgi:hypothetical protein
MAVGRRQRRARATTAAVSAGERQSSGASLGHTLPEGFRHIRHYGLHHPYHRRRKLKQARTLLGLKPEPPAVKKLDLQVWLKVILGEAAVDRCPRCGAEQAMVKRSEFEQLSWLQLILFALSGLKPRLKSGTHPVSDWGLRAAEK